MKIIVVFFVLIFWLLGFARIDGETNGCSQKMKDIVKPNI